MTTIGLSTLAKAVLLPPNLLFIFMILGALVALRYARFGRALGVAAFALLVVFSVPVTGSLLLRQLADVEPFFPGGRVKESAAIVILGAEAATALELGGETAGRRTLERLRYGARLHRQLNLPVLVTGGTLNADRRPVGELMAETLEDDFGVVARWREIESRNTYENAVLSNRLLQKAGIKHVYLVTHALHMKRARDVFTATGFEVTQAPVGVYDPKRRWAPEDFIPSAHGLAGSTAAIYEFLGRIWYRFRYMS